MMAVGQGDDGKAFQLLAKALSSQLSEHCNIHTYNFVQGGHCQWQCGHDLPTAYTSLVAMLCERENGAVLPAAK